MTRRSVSGEEAELASWMEAWLGARGMEVVRVGNSLLAVAGDGPLLLLDSHLDTVPPADGWTRDPFRAEVVDGRVYGLGGSDAKASVAAMTAAFLALAEHPPACTVALALVEGEETNGRGTERALAALAARGLVPAAAVVGEPTGLDVARAQKGLLVLELVASGQACHAAHAAALGAPNAVRRLARDLVAIDAVDLGPAHPELGPTTLQPTVVQGGATRNVVPERASAILDVRTTPAVGHEELVGRLRGAVEGELRVISDRLRPRETPLDDPLVRAALAARRAARPFASPTLSDLALLPAGIPAIKCGPGDSRLSHTPDEHVSEGEIVAGAAMIEALVRRWAAAASA